MTSRMNQSSTLLTQTFGLRQMFYLVLPSETSYPQYKQVPSYISTATPYFLGMALLEYILCVFLKVRTARISDGFSSVSAGVIQQTPKLFAVSLTVPLYLWVYDNYRLFSFQWDNPVTWYMSFLVMDFGYYAFHRLSHEVNIAWGAHQVHHSSEDYNLTTALRQSVFQDIFSSVLYIPLALFLPPSHYLIHQQLNTLFQFWIHTECIDTLGPLEYFLNTPSHHRVHHGRNVYCIDKNYAGVLIIWDRMFGTFEAERKSDPVVYGLVTPIASWNPFWIQICIYIKLFNRFNEVKGLKNKLSVLLKGPGWTEGSPRLGDRSTLPDVHAPQPRYGTGVTNAIAIYGLIHFVLLIGIFDSLVQAKRELTAVYLSAGIFFILFSLMCLGFIFENRKEAISFEVTRLIVVFMSTFLGEMFEIVNPNIALITRSFLIASVGFWVHTHYNKKKKVE